MKRAPRRSVEEIKDLPIITITESYTRIFQRATDVMGAALGDRISFRIDEGQHQICILPSMSDADGSVLSDAKGTLQTRSKWNRDVAPGKYTLKEPEYDERDGIDWFTLVKVD